MAGARSDGRHVGTPDALPGELVQAGGGSTLAGRGVDWTSASADRAWSGPGSTAGRLRAAASALVHNAAGLSGARSTVRHRAPERLALAAAPDGGPDIGGDDERELVVVSARQVLRAADGTELHLAVGDTPGMGQGAAPVVAAGDPAGAGWSLDGDGAPENGGIRRDEMGLASWLADWRSAGNWVRAGGPPIGAGAPLIASGAPVFGSGGPLIGAGARLAGASTRAVGSGAGRSPVAGEAALVSRSSVATARGAMSDWMTVQRGSTALEAGRQSAQPRRAGATEPLRAAWSSASSWVSQEVLAAAMGGTGAQDGEAAALNLARWHGAGPGQRGANAPIEGKGGAGGAAAGRDGMNEMVGAGRVGATGQGRSQGAGWGTAAGSPGHAARPGAGVAGRRVVAGNGSVSGEARAERRAELVLRRAPAARGDAAVIEAVATGWGAASHEHGGGWHEQTGAAREHSGAGNEHRGVQAAVSASHGQSAASASTSRGSTTNALAIQRVISEAGEPFGPAAGSPETPASGCNHDPQKLAEQIYRVIRRRLAIDRERAGASRSGRRW